MKFLIKYSELLNISNDLKEYLTKIISSVNKIYILIDDNDYSQISVEKQKKISLKYEKKLSSFPFTKIILKQDKIDNIINRNHLDVLITTKNENYGEFVTCININNNPKEEIDNLLEDANKPILEDINVTDKPSQDKVFIKYYNQKALRDLKRYSMDKSSIYTHIYNQNKDFLYDVALDYYGNKITYNDLFVNIKSFQKAFLKQGVKYGDKVSICTPNVPSGIYAYYALQNIGAIPAPLHVYTKSSIMKKYFETEETKYIVMIGMDEVYQNIEEAIKDNNRIQKIIVIPLTSSLGLNSFESIKTKIGINILTSKFGKIITNMTRIVDEYKKNKTFNLLKRTIYNPIFKIPKDTKYISLNDFLNEGKNTEIVYNKNDISTIIHTGGTTGVGKSTILSHDNINSNDDAFEATIQNFERGDTIITIPPMFHILGLNNCISLILRNGGKIVLISKYQKTQLPRLFKKYHPELFFGVPKLGRDIISVNGFDKVDFSHLKYYVLGGEEMSKNFIDISYEFLKSHGAKINVSQSLGGTEGSCSYTNTFENCNVHGSIGIPLINLNVKIIKEENGKITEVGYNEYGEICFNGNSIMVGYLQDSDATNNALQKHDDGKIWLHTGDLGYITRDGILYFVDRSKDMLKINGEQVYPSEIKKIILSHPNVKECAVICIENDGKKRIVAVVTLNNIVDNKKVIDEILELCTQNLQRESVPMYIDVRESLPETNLFKLDNGALTREYSSKQKKLIF